MGSCAKDVLVAGAAVHLVGAAAVGIIDSSYGEF